MAFVNTSLGVADFSVAFREEDSSGSIYKCILLEEKNMQKIFAQSTLLKPCPRSNSYSTSYIHYT